MSFIFEMNFLDVASEVGQISKGSHFLCQSEKQGFSYHFLSSYLSICPPCLRHQSIPPSIMHHSAIHPQHPFMFPLILPSIHNHPSIHSSLHPVMHSSIYNRPIQSFIYRTSEVIHKSIQSTVLSISMVRFNSLNFERESSQ